MNMAVDSIGSQYQNYSPTQLKGQQLDQKDFLRLMTAQLSSQDPFNPIDNQQMVAQMAQFSSLAGINDTNTVLAEISKQIAAQTELLKDIKTGGSIPTPKPTPTEG